MYCKKQEYGFFLGKKSICVKCLLLTHLYCKTAKSHPHRTTKGVGEIKPLKARLRSQVHNWHHCGVWQFINKRPPTFSEWLKIMSDQHCCYKWVHQITKYSSLGLEVKFTYRGHKLLNYKLFQRIKEKTL